MVTHVLEEPHGEDERRARDDVERRARMHHLIDVEHGIVEVKRRLAADDIVRIDGKRLRDPFRVVHDRPLPDDDAFRHACRS